METRDTHYDRLEVGRPYPDEVAGHREGTIWVPETGLLLATKPGITQDEVDSWGPRMRVTFTAHRSQIVCTLQYLNDGVAVEYPGTRPEGSPMPDWVTDDTGGQHLSLNTVFVDCNTGLVVHLGWFTTSPHVTKVLRADARTRWAEGVSPQEATADFTEYVRRYPDLRGARKAAMASCRPGD